MVVGREEHGQLLGICLLYRVALSYIFISQIESNFFSLSLSLSVCYLMSLFYLTPFYTYDIL